VAFLNNCIVNGNTASLGGGIISVGQITLTDSPVTGNSATGSVLVPSGFGDGILNNAEGQTAGTASLTRSPVRFNIATNDGGGIGNAPGATATLSDHSDVADNSTTSDGGGIANGGHMELTDSPVTHNNAAQNGGGIANKLGAASIKLTNSDVEDNDALHDGGGIVNQAGNTVALDHSKVKHNSPNDCSGVVPSC